MNPPKELEIDEFFLLELLNHPDLKMIGEGTKVLTPVEELRQKCRCEACEL